MLRLGTGEPLVLFHGITATGQLWQATAERLADRFDVIAPTALGHVGGPPLTQRPATIAAIVDDAERLLDELGLQQAHLAGNSMGGWVALELARRGRAKTVCALSPAGFWEPGSPEHKHTRALIGRMARDARRSRRILPLIFRSARLRRWGTRLNAVHGDRIAPTELLRMTDTMLACEARDDLLQGTTEFFPRLDPAPCPITLAWSAEDRIFPPAVYRPRAEALIPDARFILLDDVGHAPMLDDPALVAETIATATGVAAPAAA